MCCRACCLHEDQGTHLRVLLTIVMLAGVAFVPYAIYVLSAAPFLSALGTAVTMSLLMLVPLVLTDRLFYGRWTVGSPLAPASARSHLPDYGWCTACETLTQSPWCKHAMRPGWGKERARREKADWCLGPTLQAGVAQHALTCVRFRAQVTLWNFLKYNVMGGGDSALYGVESTTFYLRNALTNLNLVLPLALLVPLSALFLMSKKRGDPAHQPLGTCRGGPQLRRWQRSAFLLPRRDA